MRGSRLVYSTDGGRLPITDERPRSSRKSGPGIPNDGVVRIFRERGGRGGKIVTAAARLRHQARWRLTRVVPLS